MLRRVPRLAARVAPGGAGSSAKNRLAPGLARDYLRAMDQPHSQPAETEESRDHAAVADQLRAMIASWDGIDSPRKDELIAGFQSLIDEGGIPLEEVEAWVNSWGTPGELPEPQPRK